MVTGGSDMLFFDPAEAPGSREREGLAHDPFNSIVGPRPIGWIGSRNAAGVPNLAPYSFFNAFNYIPPVIGFSSNGWKHSVANIAETGMFTWNLATKALAEAMNRSSAPVEAEVDEFALAGLTAVPGRVVDAPRVGESPVAFECRLMQQIRMRDVDGRDINAWLTLGQVVGVHVDRMLVRNGVYDTAAARPILRGGGPTAYVEIGPEMFFHMTRPEC